jgi:hypothetical protein
MTTWALMMEPEYLRERAGRFVPPCFGAWVAFGVLSVRLGHVSAG